MTGQGDLNSCEAGRRYKCFWERKGFVQAFDHAVEGIGQPAYFIWKVMVGLPLFCRSEPASIMRAVR